jgi:hypothetical protein
MPKDIIDYSNTIIYKIYCNDIKITDIYVGHTTNFIKRKYQHKCLCNTSSKLRIYNVIRENGGWDNWSMIEIAKYNCQDATEARIREQEHYDLLKHTLNSVKSISANEYSVLSHDNSIGNGLEAISCQKPAKVAHRFNCSICDYFTDKKSSYDKHLLTVRHMELTKVNKNEQKSCSQISNRNEMLNCKFCEKTFKSRVGLWKHNKHCNSETKNKKENDIKNDINKDELILMLIKENTDFKNMMMKVLENGTINNCHNTTNNTTNTNSHNKAFNLNLFLNETCKNAMNITDFVDSIKLQLSDFMNVGESGFIQGISNIIVNKLNSLDETVRPIHCTDQKRETFYVKDENKWEKEEEDLKNIRKMIKKVVRKNEGLMMEYKKEFPDYDDPESKRSDQYSKFVIEALGGEGDNDKEKENKIIKHISKATIIKK